MATRKKTSKGRPETAPARTERPTSPPERPAAAPTKTPAEGAVRAGARKNANARAPAGRRTAAQVASTSEHFANSPVEYFVDALRLLVEKHDAAQLVLAADAPPLARGYADQARSFEAKLLACATNSARELKKRNGAYNVLSLLGELAFHNSKQGADLSERDFDLIRGFKPRPPTFPRDARDSAIRLACAHVEEWLKARDDPALLSPAVHLLWAARQDQLPGLVGDLCIEEVEYDHQWILRRWPEGATAERHARRTIAGLLANPPPEPEEWTVDPAYAGADGARREAARFRRHIEQEAKLATRGAASVVTRAQSLTAELVGLTTRMVQNIVRQGSRGGRK